MVGGGGGLENGLPSPRANFVCFYPMLMGSKIFHKKIPHLCMFNIISAS